MLGDVICSFTVQVTKGNFFIKSVVWRHLNINTSDVKAAGRLLCTE